MIGWIVGNYLFFASLAALLFYACVIVGRKADEYMVTPEQNENE